MATDAPAPAPAPSAAAAAPAPAATTTKKKTTKTKRKTKRKKPTSSSSSRATAASSAASATAIWNAAHAAKEELSQQKVHAAARKSDPLWYRVEEPLQSVAGETAMASGILADQVELVEAALLNHNLTRVDLTPQAFACLLEQARRFALELYADAQDYAYAANRHEVSRGDLLLAAELRPSNTNMSLATLQPRLSHLAQQVNRVPLPPIPTNCYHGIVLPPKEHQLTARTFDVISGAQVAQRMVAPPPATPAKKASKKTKNVNKTSYGAKRGQQIPIQLKESAPSAPTPMDVVPAPGTSTTNAMPPAPAGASAPSAPAPAAGPGAPAGMIAAPGIDGGTKRKADQM